MSDHKFENINGVGILTSVLTPEPLNDIETLKLIAPYEIPRLREEIDTLKLEIAYLKQEQVKFITLCVAIDEGMISVILEGADSSIDGGVIVTII